MNDNYKEKLLKLFQNDNGATMSDYELLELLFSIVNPRADSQKLSAAVLKNFKNFSKAINAPAEKLLEIDSMHENSMVALKLISACAKRAFQEASSKQNTSILAKWSEFTDFCRQNMAYEDVEEFRIFLLDSDFQCFENKLISKGTVNQTYASPREVILLAINANAAHVILAHNHPSGDCKPSNSDDNLTKTIFEAAVGAGIDIFDHLIITENQIYSYRENGFFVKNQLK